MTIDDRYHDLSTGDYELDRLRMYLSDWRALHPPITSTTAGLPGAVPWLQYMKPNISWDNEQTDRDTINFEGLKIIDRGVDVISEQTPELAIALRWRYLNAKVGLLVFRYKRLEGLSFEQLDDLADAAERALLPIVKRMGLIL